MRRRTFLAAAALLPASRFAAATPAGAEDFDTLWRAIDERYAYFDPATKAAWQRARGPGRARARAAATRADFLLALESAIAHLCDDAVTLAEHAPASPRRIPAETDLWAEWKNGEARVVAVRASGEADVAGMHPGHVVTHVDGVVAERAARDLLRRTGVTSPAAMNWALRRLLAGPRAGTLRLTVRDTRGPAVIEIERAAPGSANGPPLVARRMGEDRDLGYIRIRNALGDARFAAQFDGALDYLKETRGLILDLRDTPDGGTREGVEAILGRFVDKEAPWQLRELPHRAERTTDVVKPRGATYRAPLMVLVDHWTAGDGEALAAGLDAAARATLIGTAMAGVRGERGEVVLRQGGIVARFPVARTFHVNGTPREALRPAVAVDLAAPSGGPGDPILYQALKRFDPRR